jgi:hypothetical protein
MRLLGALGALGLALARTSLRAQARLEVGAAPTEGVQCSLGAREGFNGTVDVYVDLNANSRMLTFSGDGVGAQTAVKCAGNPGPGCAPGSNCADCPCAPTGDLDFGYMKLIAEDLEPRCAEARILLVGLGGGAMLTHLLDKCPHATIESVEYDPRVVEVATRFFGVPQDSRSKIETGDGGAAVAQRAERGETYDAVVVDCFAGGGEVPLACRSDEFLDGLRAICKDTGEVIQQVWSPQFDELMPHYEKRFGSVTHRDLSLGVNHLIFASDPHQ